MQELSHTCVLDAPVDLDLTHQLLLCSALGQASLHYNLGSVDLICVLGNHLIALSEAPLAQELASLVSACLHVACRLDDLFFYNFRELVSVVIHCLILNFF